MSSPPRLRRHDPPALVRHRHDPVAGLTALLLGVVVAGLAVLAVMVVSAYAIVPPPDKDGGVPGYALSTTVVAPLAVVIAIVFFTTVAFNIAAATARHFRRDADA